MNFAMFFDSLTPIKVLSLTTKQEVHDPVNNIKRINEFSWTMTKLKILIPNSLDESSKWLTSFTKILKEVTLTENGEYKYQDITLHNYQASLNALSNNYKEFISKINKSVEWRFSGLQNSPIFANLPVILECKKWPQTNEQLMSFGDDKIETFKVHLMPLLEKNSFEIGSIMFEWDRWRVEINSFSRNEKVNSYELKLTEGTDWLMSVSTLTISLANLNIAGQ